MKRTNSTIIWQEVVWNRPFSQADTLAFLTHLATLAPRGNIVWEIRGTGGNVRYFIGSERNHIKSLKAALSAHGMMELADVPEKERKNVTIAKQIKRTKSTLSLKTDNTLMVLKTAISALANTKNNETLVVQVVLGESYAPSPAPDKASDPHATLLDTLCGRVGTASKESLQSIKSKSVQHGFFGLIRIGATANTVARAVGLLHNIMSAFRQLETTGVKLILAPCEPTQINGAKIPWFLLMRLSIAELAGFALLPCTDVILKGVRGLHPKMLRPPAWLEDSSERNFATSLGANPQNLHIPVNDSLTHTVILGGTGSGKSTVMLNLIMSDIKAGRGVLVVDPKADLINDILARIPEERTDDVVVIDPSDVTPVGINPFVFNKQSSPSLISDVILSCFRQIYKDSWGVYSQDVLSAALLTLAQTKNATLLQLPALLFDEQFRRSVTSKIHDPYGLEPFWGSFEAMSKAEQRQVTAPVMNKLRQFTLRPALRNMLGQVKPKFNLSDLFDNNKIVLVPLNKGLIGGESARLLGSLIVGLTWTLALSRANIPKEKRNPVSVFIDELQDYLALPTDFSDALAQARGLAVGFTVAHQYRGQLSPAIKAAIDTNCRNKICFGLGSSDSKEMAAMSTELEVVDFMKLPRYHIYTQTQNKGRSTGWIIGKTTPPTPALRPPAKVKLASMTRYGQALPDPIPLAEPEPLFPNTPIGRKKIA